jgi:hypothetical protein
VGVYCSSYSFIKGTEEGCGAHGLPLALGLGSCDRSSLSLVTVHIYGYQIFAHHAPVPTALHGRINVQMFAIITHIYNGRHGPDRF